MNELNNLMPINEWFKKLDSRPIIISGPSSSKSEEQVLNTARQLKEIDQVKIFRSSIWKPRANVNNFDGRGDNALQWLNQVKLETNLLTMVEVASPKHVEMCLRHNVDILWIGAETTSNPFSIQELASALQGMNVPVMIKNPLNPDIDLWIRALEQINKAGISKLAAIHCGFYPFEQTSLRNIPKWEIPIELKSRFHNLPMICDPSHIAGDKEHIQQISQKALDLNMDGLMIDSDFNPEVNLNQKEQQVLPSELNTILNRLVCRLSIKDSEDYNPLGQYRNQIDSIDAQLIALIAQRMNVVSEIGDYKSEHNLNILQLKRWEKVREQGTELGKSLGLSEKFLTQLLRMIHKEAILIQNDVMNNKE
jgi:chorismate mutase